MTLQNAIADFNRRHRAGADAAADALASFIRETISDPYPPASDPFSPPHSRSGELKDGVYAYAEGTEIVFGDSAPHASFLELGTWKMLPRPFLSTAMSSGGSDAMMAAYEDAFHA